MTSPSLIELMTRLAGGAAVRGRRFHDVARRPLGDPKRLEHEARLDLAVDREQQGHAADHPVVVRQPVQEAETLRGVGELGDRRQHAVEGRDQGRRRIADEGESGLGREARLGAVVGRREIRAEDDGTALNGLSKSGVAIGALLTARRRIGAMAAALGALRDIAGSLVLLGKQVVEPDGGDVRLDERIDQIRHLPARPGPSADQVNRFVVDVDDADRLAEVVGPRLPPLVLIEDQVVDIAAQRPEQVAKRDGQKIGGDDDQHVGTPFLQLTQRPGRADLHFVSATVCERTEGPEPPLEARW